MFFGCGVAANKAGNVAVSGGGGVSDLTFVDWWTWNGVGDDPQKTRSTHGATSATFSVTQSLSAGLHVFMVTQFTDVQSATDTGLTVGGVEATKLGNFDEGGLTVTAFSYDVAEGGDIVVAITPNGNTSNRALAIWQVPDDATLGFTPALPITGSGQNVAFVSLTDARATPYEPEGVAATAEHANIDLRSNEWFVARSYVDIGSDITADADGSGAWVAGAVTVT